MLNKSRTPAILIVLLLLLFLSCTPREIQAPQDYASINEELAQTRQQLLDTQIELQEAQQKIIILGNTPTPLPPGIQMWPSVECPLCQTCPPTQVLPACSRSMFPPCPIQIQQCPPCTQQQCEPCTYHPCSTCAPLSCEVKACPICTVKICPVQVCPLTTPCPTSVPPSPCPTFYYDWMFGCKCNF